jgi:hypothetical protein
MSRTRFVIILFVYIALFVGAYVHKALTKKIQGPYERSQQTK